MTRPCGLLRRLFCGLRVGVTSPRQYDTTKEKGTDSSVIWKRVEDPVSFTLYEDPSEWSMWEMKRMTSKGVSGSEVMSGCRFSRRSLSLVDWGLGLVWPGIGLDIGGVGLSGGAQSSGKFRWGRELWRLGCERIICGDGIPCRDLWFGAVVSSAMCRGPSRVLS